MPNWFVILMGICTVFVGLICIIIVCSIMSALVRLFDKNGAAQNTKQIADNGTMPDREKLVVAISAAIAEELGEDVGAIRILSLKKV